MPVLTVLGVITPVIFAALMWSMRKEYATREWVEEKERAILKEIALLKATMEKDLESSAKQLREHLTLHHEAVIREIRSNHDAVCKDINGVGARIEGVFKVAELGVRNADDAQHKADILEAELRSIDEHGTRAMKEVMRLLGDIREDIAALRTERLKDRLDRGDR